MSTTGLGAGSGPRRLGPPPSGVPEGAVALPGGRPRPVDLVLRALDVLVAGTVLALASPALAAGALLVLLADGRPVLYRGPRVGRGGRPYRMLKLRTLKVDAEARLPTSAGPALTAGMGDELIRGGGLLRATKVDELPQLVNVLRGDMSLVGPRPVRPAAFAELSDQVPQTWQRLVVRPGLTGLAQLRRDREASWAEKLAHDMEWIADRSVRLYLRLVVTTGLLLLARRRSERPDALHRLP